MAEDTRLFDVAQRLLECAYERVAATEAGPPERACVIAGGLAWDNCECGQLTVALVNTFASSNFPTPSGNEAGQYGGGRCGSPITVMVLNVTMLRCVPGGDDSPEPPACLDLALSARTAAIDAAAVRAGVECCLSEMLREKDENGTPVVSYFYTGDQNFVGPEGLCGGSSLNVVVGVLASCPCPE